MAVESEYKCITFITISRKKINGMICRIIESYTCIGIL